MYYCRRNNIFINFLGGEGGGGTSLICIIVGGTDIYEFFGWERGGHLKCSILRIGTDIIVGEGDARSLMYYL